MNRSGSSSMKQFRDELNGGGSQHGEDGNQMEPDNIQGFIEILYEHQINCEKQGKYVEAELAKNRISELKKKEKQRQDESLRQKQMNEKLEIEQAHLVEFNEFNREWDEKMNDFHSHAQILEKGMLEKHEQEIMEFRDNIDHNLPERPKLSAELLNQRKIQENLARQKDYQEAHKVQLRAQHMEKEEFGKWQEDRGRKIDLEEKRLLHAQEQELNALRKKIQAGHDQQRRQRALALEELLQRYQNVKKELESQQKHELIRSKKPGSKYLDSANTSLMRSSLGFTRKSTDSKRSSARSSVQGTPRARKSHDEGYGRATKV